MSPLLPRDGASLSMPSIGTTLPFERLFLPLLGKPADHFGEVTIIADTTTWRIAGIRIFEEGFSFWLHAKTPLFEKMRLAIHRQCGEDIERRLNAFVEERGGYEILFGEAMPADPIRRGRPRCLVANDNDRDIHWIDEAA